MEALSNLMDKVDQIKDQISEGDYLVMCNLMKDINVQVISDEMFALMSAKVCCYPDGVFCQCNADARLKILMNDAVQVPRYLKLIAKMAETITDIVGDLR